MSQCIADLRAYAVSQSLQAEIVVCGELSGGESTGDAKVSPVTPAYKGRCIRQGILRSTGAVVIVCDADLPVSLEDITALRKKLTETDVALGNRYLPESQFIILSPYHRRFVSIVFRFLVRILFNLKGFDTQCGIKAFTRVAALSLYKSQVVRSLAYDVEVLLRARRAGMRITQVPVHWQSSMVSTINVWRSVFPALIDLINLRVAHKV